MIRKERPYVFTNVRAGEGVEKVERFIIERGGLAA
jgi:urease accessory protein